LPKSAGSYPGPPAAGNHMDCDDAIHRIYGFLDGELTVWRRREILRHLDECPPCAHGYDFEMELRQVIAMKCRDEVPPELRRRIAEALGYPVPGSG